MAEVVALTGWEFMYGPASARASGTGSGGQTFDHRKARSGFGFFRAYMTSPGQFTAVTLQGLGNVAAITNGNRGRVRTRFWFNAFDRPSADLTLFSCVCGPSSFQGGGILLTSTGTLRCFYNTVSGGPYVAGTATTGAAPEGDPEAWVRVDLEIEGFPNGTSDEINVDATVYFPDGTSETISASFLGSLGASFTFGTFRMLRQAGTMGFGNLTAEIWLDDWILIAASNADEPGMSALPSATRIAPVWNAGAGASAGWSGNWLQASKRAVNSSADGKQTAGSAGLDTTFAHQSAALCGLSGIEGISVLALARAGGTITPTILWNGSTYSGGVSSVGSAVPTFGSDATWACILGSLSNAAFDAAEWGFRSVHATTNELYGMFAEVLHAGAAVPSWAFDPGAGYRHAWITWTGDGATERAIAGLGFRPTVVWIFPIAAGGSPTGVASISTIYHGYNINTSGGITTGHVITFDSDGFSLGSGGANASGQKYVALCVRDDGFLDGADLSFAFTFGAFHGNSQAIAFRDTNGTPKLVILAASNVASSGATWMKIADMATAAARLSNTSAAATDAIVSLDANGFTTGANLAITNIAGWPCYLAWIDRPGVTDFLAVGEIAPVAADVAVSAPGVYAVLARGNNTSNNASTRFDEADYSGASCSTYTAGAITRTNGIIGLDANGFTIDGTTGAHLSATVEAWWAAFGVSGLLEAPVGVDDAYAGTEGQALTVAAGAGVLANDTGPTAGALTAELVTAPASGDLVLNADGSFTYTPDPGFFGVDSFTYRPVGAAGGDGSIATVTITIASAAVPGEPRIAPLLEFSPGGFRRWVRSHASILAHWHLGEIGPNVGAENGVPTGDAGIYAGDPLTGRGLLPEWGLSTAFNGVDQYVEIGVSAFGLGSAAPFSFVALARPGAQSPAAARCIMQTGPDGGYLGLDSANRVVFGRNGGTKAQTTAALENGGEYLLVGSYDGTTATVRAYRLDETDPDARLIETASATVTIGPHNDGASPTEAAKIGANNSEEWLGELQGIAVFSAALSGAEALEILETAVWTDLTDDLEASAPLVVDRGIHDDSPIARMAATGRCTFMLDNSERNSAGLVGYYSPGHANCRAGFDDGAMVRVSLEVENVAVVQFIGAIDRITPEPGPYRERRTAVVALDWLDEAARAPLTGLEALESVRADEVIAALINNMENRPHEIALEVGTDTYAVALHNVTDERSTVASELERLTRSELGYCFIRTEGALVFEARSTRSESIVPAYTLTEYLEAEITRDRRRRINRVRATAHPARVGASGTEILYSADGSTRIDNGADVELFFQFRDPDNEAVRVGGLDVITPVAVTDYTLNTAEGSPAGTDVTSHPAISLEWTIGGNGIYLRIVNGYGLPVYITFLQVRGRGVYEYDPVQAIAEDLDAIALRGLQPLDIDLPYIGDVNTATAAAQRLLSEGAATDTRAKSVTIAATTSAALESAALGSEISDRVALEEPVTALEAPFFIQGKRIEVRAAGEVNVTWFLAPADPASYWILDESELGESTRLGY